MLDVEGVHNIRDLGGLPTRDGRRTRSGSPDQAAGMRALLAHIRATYGTAAAYLPKPAVEALHQRMMG